MQELENIHQNELVSRVKVGDSEAFSKLVELYMPMLSKLVSGFASSFVRSDEAFCEACVAFYRAAMSYNLGQNKVTFGLYARICVYRRLCDLVGKEMRREEFFSDLDIDSLAVTNGIESRLVGKEMMANALRKIKTILSKYEYDVFMLYLHGFSTAAIAQRLDKSAKSVDNAKARCFKRLREESDMLFNN